MAGALDQVLQEQIVGALFGFADLGLEAEHAEAQFLADGHRRVFANFKSYGDSFSSGWLHCGQSFARQN